METSNPKTCSIAHSMMVLLCNNGRLQLARKLICVGCICIYVDAGMLGHYAVTSNKPCNAKSSEEACQL